MELLSFITRGAMLVTALTVAVPVHALGLGNAAVSSHLGEPLNARITLLGNPSDLNPDCFKIVADKGNALPLPSDISLTLDQSGTRPSLLVRSRRALNEPILMFTISAACPERVERDYALLLDPPNFSSDIPLAGAEPVTAPASPVKATGIDQARKSDKRGKASSSTASHLPHRDRPAGKRIHKPAIRTPENDGPRLVLTGSRRLFSPASAQLALNLDIALLDTTRRAEVPLTADELTDENTALTRKVAHLEEVLTNLQKRNAELQAARAKSTQDGSPGRKPEPEKLANRSNWPYFLFGLVLFTGGTAYLIYRRRQGVGSQYEEAEIWRMPALQPAEAGNGAKAKQSEGGGAGRQDFAPMPSVITAREDEGTEVKDSVADEVEVFVAHGHSDLAIHMLEDHVEKTPEESPVAWLLLLDLLKRDGAEIKYEDYRQRCKRHFNVAIPAFGEIELNPGDDGLESYAHITAELVRLWPTDQVIDYLDDLIYDRRGGSRMGFDPATYRDIVLLRSVRAS